MRIRPASVAAAFALSTLAFTGLAAPAVAQTPICDPYSQNCPPPPGPAVETQRDCYTDTTTTTYPDGRVVTTEKRHGIDPAEIDPTCVESTSTDLTTNTALPFTGGELVTMTAVGAGALAVGVALVAAGRRRKPDVA